LHVRWYYEGASKDISRKPYRLEQSWSWQHNALSWFSAQVGAQQLHLYTHHSSDCLV